jgi:hypothetical protein
MQYNIDQCDASRGDTYQLAKQFGRQLIDNTREVIGAEALKKERLVCERDAAANRMRVLESEAVDARRRIGEREEKFVFSSLLFLNSSSDRFSVGCIKRVYNIM